MGEGLSRFALQWFHCGFEVERDPFQFRHLSSNYFPEDAFQRSLFGQMIVRLAVHIALPA
jgi:hypothetical protein